MNYYVEDPHWTWEIIAYFFLGGIAAGSYFLAVLIEWFGSEEDAALTTIAYRIAFPLIVVSALLLTIDLDQPLRFWHMMFQSEVVKQALAEGFPSSGAGWRTMTHAVAFKYWSPMSAGSWGLVVFGACSFISFVGTLLPRGFRVSWLPVRLLHFIFQLLGCIAGFFIASYTGALLSATNQPMWSDTVWLAPLFLASAASTSLATLSLLARWGNVGTPAARERLEGSGTLALGLELVVLGAFVASLGDNLFPVLMTWRGRLLIFGTLLLSVLLPLLLHAHVGRRRAWGVPAAALCALLGGLMLRYGAVTTPGELLRRGPAVADSWAPEEHRRSGEPGADVGDHSGGVPYRSKLPREPEK
jgi:formate-dependent nitrite reductase membrane component NrfD